MQARLVARVVVRRTPAHVGQDDQALVALDLGAADVEAVDVFRRLEALDVEALQALEIDSRGWFEEDDEFEVRMMRIETKAARAAKPKKKKGTGGGNSSGWRTAGGGRRR